MYWTRLVIVSLVVFGVFIGTATADRSTFDETKTRVAMPLPEPPIIDGVIDLGGNESWMYAAGEQSGGNSYWELRFDIDEEDFVLGGNVASGEGPWDENDFAADIWAGYDDDYLYVAVRVTDDFLYDDSATAGSANEQTWHDDSVEVFVDGDNSNYDQRDTAGDRPEGFESGGQYVVTINNAYRENEAGNPGYGENKAWYGYSSVISDTQYDYEFQISWDILGGKPEPGEIIGFDVAINDDDDGDTLENQYTWSGATHEEHSYGNLVIGPREYSAPKVASAPTVDGTIDSGEYGDAEEVQVDHFSGNYNGNDNWELGDHDYSFWAVHDDDAIYIAVQVTDDQVVTDTADAGSEDGQTWIDDSVEVFLDSDASDDLGRTSANEFEGQFVMTPNGAYRDNEANNPTFDENWFAAASATDTGYIIEFKMMKDMLFEMKEIMGFDVAVNDDDGADRKTQLAWNGRPHNESSYGTLILSAGQTDIANWSLY